MKLPQWKNLPSGALHDAEFAKRQESHKKTRPTSRQPYVRRTEKSASAPKNAAPAAEPGSASE